MKRLALIAVLAAVAVAALTAPLGGSTATRSGGSVRGNFGLERAKSFDGFALYAVGTRFEGLPLVASFRRLDAPDRRYSVRANYVSFIYGVCSAVNGMGCAPPLEVQIWPACERNPSVYEWSPAEAAAIERTRIRGVPAIFYDGGRRLELSTGASTVVIFARTKEQLARAAAGLTGLNLARAAGAVLPAPVRGAVEGRLACS